MKVLCVGDVVSRVGRDMLFRYVDELKYRKDIDFVIVNGENSSHGRGMTRSCYDEMKRAGTDVFTTGNHVWGCKEIRDLMKEHADIVRPLNMQGEQDGVGSMIVTASNGVKVGVINLIGQQSPQINNAVSSVEEIGAGDQGTMFGYATAETSSRLPFGFDLANKIIKAIESNRNFKGMPFGFHFIRFLQGILPFSWFDYIIGNVCGVYHTMDNFTGRKKS